MKFPVSLRGGTQGGPGSQGINISRALDNIILAQNELVESYVTYENARLEFHRDTGTMVIRDDGFWADDVNAPAPPDGNSLSVTTAGSIVLGDLRDSPQSE